MERKIIEIICSYAKISEEAVGPDSRLMQDIGLSSYDVISLVAEFEDAFDIEIPDRMIVDIRTVGDIADIIKNLSL